MTEFDKKIKEQTEDFFPFSIVKGPDDILDVVAGSIFPIYDPIFSTYGLYGNGPGWEGLLTQAIESLAPELLSEIEFDSEADCCRMIFSNGVAAFKVIKTLRPHLTEEIKLKKLLSEIDIDEIDS